MLTELRPALVLLLIFTLLTGLLYPLAVTAIAQLTVAAAANGSLIEQHGQVVGSALIGQNFATDRYFWPRPSAAGTAGYDATASSGSNLGPTSKKLLERVAGDARRIEAATGATMLPADAVTASGSGLDPDISPGYAMLQVPRIARARAISEEAVRQLVATAMQEPLLGIFGEPRVNVLLLNQALDALSSG